MNERIKELAEQAKLNPVLLLQHWGTNDALTDSEQESLERIEKFAELIVQECANICFEQGEISWNDDHKIQAKIDGHLIKKHFGVE